METKLRQQFWKLQKIGILVTTSDLHIGIVPIVAWYGMVRGIGNGSVHMCNPHRHIGRECIDGERGISSTSKKGIKHDVG
jgi:hypothetical protein